MLVGEWMSRDVVTVGVNDKISRVAALMSRLRIKQVPVLDGDKLAGLVTRSDLIRACPPDLNPFSLLGPIAEELAQPVRHFVATETVTVAPETPLEGAAHLLIARNINALPVVSAGKVVGIIAGSDICRALLAALGAGVPGVRITFDVGEDEDVFTFVTDLARKHGVRVVSVTAFEQERQRVAVVRVDHEKPDMVDEIWRTGHRVSSVARFA
jgi:acetoin utilization protein AcuB